jgi:hypothetical protein
MIGSNDGLWLVYSNICELMVYQYTTKGLELIGNGRHGWHYYKGTLWGKTYRRESYDRSKSGTKRSIVIDDNGVPLGITVGAANRSDMKMTKATLQSIVVDRPEPIIRSKHHRFGYGL